MRMQIWNCQENDGAILKLRNAPKSWRGGSNRFIGEDVDSRTDLVVDHPLPERGLLGSRAISARNVDIEL